MYEADERFRVIAAQALIRSGHIKIRRQRSLLYPCGYNFLELAGGDGFDTLPDEFHVVRFFVVRRGSHRVSNGIHFSRMGSAVFLGRKFIEFIQGAGNGIAMNRASNGSFNEKRRPIVAVGCEYESCREVFYGILA